MPALDRSYAGRAVFVAFRLIIAAFVLWIISTGGDNFYERSFGYEKPIKRDSNRLLILQVVVVVAALRQVFWAVYLSITTLTVGSAFQVVIFNGLVETVCALIALRNGHSIGVLTYVGVILFALGSIFETGGELQRIWFKKIKANAGKPFTGGLFSISQHVNYFGYTLWRAGMALVSGSLIWTFLLVSFITYDFFTGGIPDLQKHNRERYGKEYEIYSAKTAKFVPFIY